MTYEIVKFYHNGKNRVFNRGVNLEEAQAYCSDPQTSSKTYVTPKGKRTSIMELKDKSEPWFYGYREE